MAIYYVDYFRGSDHARTPGTKERPFHSTRPVQVRARVGDYLCYPGDTPELAKLYHLAVGPPTMPFAWERVPPDDAAFLLVVIESANLLSKEARP